ncbi:hypothetical protein HHK36_020953 [Tetracentron sinense]|uniref:t-SNARE coiled-coil homology domain-containing protein n=1 Tax=Tetracentron sinense TaxID=13715 RepID=A0A834YY09_TETSI|nr:hypothetical protein HHK36_020953 [Tetracentron sinense]
MANDVQMSPQLEQIDGEIRDNFRALAALGGVVEGLDGKIEGDGSVVIWAGSESKQVGCCGVHDGALEEGFELREVMGGVHGGGENGQGATSGGGLRVVGGGVHAWVVIGAWLEVASHSLTINKIQCEDDFCMIHEIIMMTFTSLHFPPRNGFQKLDKIKDPNRQSKQLEELTGKMRECKRLIKEFDREIKDEESGNPPEVNKLLNEKKQSLLLMAYPTLLQIKELNSYVALRKTHMSSLGNKRVELFDMGAGGSEPIAEDNVQMASSMSNQELINSGMKTMDETDQAIERSKQVVEQTVEVGAQTAVTLKGQTEQMGRIVNELDTIQFSIKKASQLVKEIGRQVATDKCIMLFLFLVVCGVIAIIIVKVVFLSDLPIIVNPNNKNIRDIPGLAPPAPTRRLLSMNPTGYFE